MLEKNKTHIIVVIRCHIQITEQIIRQGVGEIAAI